jgi:hypothetical protein
MEIYKEIKAERNKMERKEGKRDIKKDTEEDEGYAFLRNIIGLQGAISQNC